MAKTEDNPNLSTTVAKKSEGVPFVIPVLPLLNTTLFPETMVPLSVGRPVPALSGLRPPFPQQLT